MKEATMTLQELFDSYAGHAIEKAAAEAGKYANVCGINNKDQVMHRNLEKTLFDFSRFLRRGGVPVDSFIQEEDELRGYVRGLLGLVQMVRDRGDCPKEIAEVLRTNHRILDAAAYLMQIDRPPVNRDGSTLSRGDQIEEDFFELKSQEIGPYASKDDIIREIRSALMGLKK